MVSARPQPAYDATIRSKNLEMAERMGVALWDLEVASFTDLSPVMRQITFTCHAPETLDFLPGNDLTLTIAARGDAVVRRRYSIRRTDPAARTVDLCFVLHGDGPASAWAASVEVGDRIEGVGPRGKVVVTDDRPWHLFIADDAFIPAATAMIESLPATTTAIVYFEVDSPTSELPVTSAATIVGPKYCFRDGTPPGVDSPLHDALASFQLPEGDGAAYVGGEHKVTFALRDLLVARGMPTADIAAKAYWRLGRANADHGEPPREE